MNRGKKLIIMAAALIVLIGAAVLVKTLTKETDAEESEPTVLYSMDSDTAQSISWTYEDETITLTKQGDNWSYSEDADFPLDEDYVSTMLSVLSEVDAEKTIEDVTDLDQYGLETPSCTVSVTAGEDSVTTEFSFGDVTELSGDQYCSDGDGNVYLVSSEIASDFSYGLYDIVEKETIPSMDQVTVFTDETASQTMEIDYLEDSGLAYDDSFVWFMKDGKNYTTLDTGLTETFTATVTEMTLGDCVCYNADDAALEEYGLDEPAATVTIDYDTITKTDTGETTDDGSTIYSETKTPGTFAMEFSSSGYCRIGDSGMIYTVDEDALNTICYTTSNDLLPDEVLIQDWDNVNSVDITMNGETWTVEHITRETEADDSEEASAAEAEETTEAEDSSEEPELETVWQLDGEDVELEDAFTSVTGMSSTGYATGLTPEHSAELTLVLHRVADTDKELTLTFYPYNSESCMVTLNGEATVLVARDDVTSLTSELSALLLG